MLKISEIHAQIIFFAVPFKNSRNAPAAANSARTNTQPKTTESGSTLSLKNIENKHGRQCKLYGIQDRAYQFRFFHSGSTPI